MEHFIEVISVNTLQLYEGNEYFVRSNALTVHQM